MEECVIFFDLGNTLARNSGTSARRMLGHLLNLSEKEVKRAGRVVMTSHAVEPESLAEHLTEALGGRDQRSVLQAVRTVWQEQIDHLSLLPDVFDVLDGLKEMHCRLGLLSNSWHPVFEALQLKWPHLLERFDPLILSYRMGVKKPSAAIFRAAIAASGGIPGRCWMVGDSYELDLGPAMNAGMRSIWVLSRPEAERGLLAEVLRGERRAPDSAVERLSDLLTVFGSSSREEERSRCSGS